MRLAAYSRDFDEEGGREYNHALTRFACEKA